MPARNHFLRGVKKGFTEGEALRVLKINPTRFTFNKKRTELKNTTKIERKKDTTFWRNTYLELSAPVEKDEKTKKTAHRRKYCLLMQYYLALPKLKNTLEMSPHSKSHRKRKKKIKLYPGQN